MEKNNQGLQIKVGGDIYLMKSLVSDAIGTTFCVYIILNLQIFYVICDTFCKIKMGFVLGD